MLSSLVIYSMASDDVYLHGQGEADIYMVSVRYLELALWLLIILCLHSP